MGWGRGRGWGTDITDIQLLCRCDKEIHFLLCVINAYGKYVWVGPLKHLKQLLKHFKKL